MKKIILTLTLIFGLNCFCLEQKQSFTQEQQTQAATNLIIKFFETAINNNVMSIEHLQRLLEAQELINPITQDERNSDSKKLVYASQLNNLILKGSLLFDIARIKDWATKKIEELERAEGKRKEVHEDTREIHMPMRFVPIPAGKYVDQITHEEFEISEGIEIQETPVTQWQWAQMMGNNPSVFVDGIDSEEILINGKKIKMRPDAPVENVSWNDVQEFIKKKNGQDQEYKYALSSVQEYQALLQHGNGSDWIKQINNLVSCSKPNKTCEFSSINHDLIKPLDVLGNVWQLTRDDVEIKDKTGHLVIGGSFRTSRSEKLINLLRPVICSTVHVETVGFRIERHQKSLKKQHKTHMYQLSWEKEDASVDADWPWNRIKQNILFKDDSELRWLLEHESECSTAQQKTLGTLYGVSYLFHSHGIDALIFSLRSFKELNLEAYNLSDITPISSLTNLQSLRASFNRIEDITPLAELINLQILDLNHNRITDITALVGLNHLESLRLSYNPIQDLYSLKQLKNLKFLYLDKNQIERLHAYEVLPDVKIREW